MKKQFIKAWENYIEDLQDMLPTKKEHINKLEELQKDLNNLVKKIAENH